MQDTLFTGQPVFCQLLSLIPRGMIETLAHKTQANRYYKKFKARDHLVTMLFTAFTGCRSLREVTTGLQAWSSRLVHLGLKYAPPRSTLADANEQRPVAFFRDLFRELYWRYYGRLPDSRSKRRQMERLFLMDSTTIQLFQDIMKAAGSSPANGKRKGGVKAHVLINAQEDVPRLVLMTPSSKNDKRLMKHVELPKGSILVFDRAYAHFKQWEIWGKEGIYWVTRANDNFIFELKEDRPISKKERQLGVTKDEIGILGRATGPDSVKIKVRRVHYTDPKTGKAFVFLTNHQRFNPSKIALFYQKRWQIELLFKRLKQNYPLRYFLGDNENAIRIQIWCSLICDLLVKIIQDKVTRRKWSYSNLASIIRLHLGNYFDLAKFLDNPDKAKAWLKTKPPDNKDPVLFPSL